MKTTLRALCLSALVAAAGCTDRNGRVNWGETALLGVGLGGAAALAGGALTDASNRPYNSYGYGRGYDGYGRGYGGGYRHGGLPPVAGYGYGGGYGYGRCSAFGCN